MQIVQLMLCGLLATAAPHLLAQETVAIPSPFFKEKTLRSRPESSSIICKGQMFVVHFNEKARFGLPAGKPFTGDVSELESAIGAFDLGGTTAFYDTLLFARPQFEKAAYSRKVLLTITDRGDNSSHATLAEALDNVAKSGIFVYPIGAFDENDRDRNPAVLSKIAQQTGGEEFFPAQVSEVT